jgi:hypothetical protein
LTECDYNIGLETWFALGPWISNVFTGYAFDFNTAIYNNGNSSFEICDSIVARIAKSMTSNMRSYGLGGPALGTGSRPETYLTVRWAWLALPAALVLLSMCFLAATIFQSRHSVAWKSSALATMFHAPIFPSEDESEFLQLHKMKAVAETTVVSLGKAFDGTVRLVPH